MMRSAFLLATLLLAGPAVAAEAADEHSGHHPPAQDAADAPAPVNPDEAMTRLRQNMQTMQDLMAQIRSSTDAAERKRLLGAHMQAMEEQIKAIRALYARSGGHDHAAADKGKEGDGPEGKEGGKKGKEMMGKEMMGGGMMKKMHKQMEQRMDAMEQLLEQFIEHEAVEDAGDDD